MLNTSLSTLQLISVRWWNASAYYAIMLAGILRHNGVKVYVGGDKNSPPIQKAMEEKLPILSLNFESYQPHHFLKNFFNYRKFLAKQDIDIVNAHRPEDHLYSALIKNKYKTLPLIRTIGDVRPPKNNRINKILHLNYTDFFIFSCRANKTRYQNIWPIPDEKCAVIYAGVDTDFFTARPPKKHIINKVNIPAEAFTFGMVGRFSPVKDHKSFLQAAGKILGKKNNVHFIISGEEVEINREELRKLACNLEIEQYVHILGKFQDVRHVMSRIDIGVVCSLDSEAISRVTAEFMSMGKPVIVTNVNVLPEMVTSGKDGFVVSVQSPDELGKAMETFIDNRELSIQMGLEARKTAVDRFSFERFYNDTIKSYQRLLQNKSKLIQSQETK
jgi:glycosyltransferase involved in cell wall biosynthesis